MVKEKLQNAIWARDHYLDFDIKNQSDFALKYSASIGKEKVSGLLTYHKFKEVLNKKIPAWADTEGLLSPDLINLEQCSSQKTAIYKAAMTAADSVLDLTAGLGVDLYFQNGPNKTLNHNEPNAFLSEIVRHNYECLDIKANYTQTLAEDFTKTTLQNLDLVHLDPDRRSESNKKLYLLEDCRPDIVKNFNHFISLSDVLTIKLSPLVDIKLLLNKVPFISEIHVLSENNDTKELLIKINKNADTEPQIITRDLGKDDFNFSFKLSDEQNTVSAYSEPKSYLYEPFSALLKAGAFKSVTEAFKLEKLATNTHLYTSDYIVSNFPGYIYQIINVVSANKKEVLSVLPNKKANIKTRNFPLKPEILKKEMGITDGGEIFLFFTELLNKKKKVLLCTKI